VTRTRAQPQPPAQPVPGSEKHLVAWRLLQPLEHLLHTLRRPDQHGNRTLFGDHLLIAHLVAFFSPALKSLRRIEDVFNHPGARRKYALPRLPHSTVSDAQARFDPAWLTPLIADLRSRVPLGPHEPRLDELLRKLLATDGTFFTLAPRVLWALYAKPNGTARQPRKQNQPGNLRVDVQFNVLAGVPEAAVVSDGRTPEYRRLVENLQPDAFYLLDRAYHSYQMMADILAAGSDFLVRLRDDMQFTVLAEEPWSAVDWAAGVRRCQTVRACGLRGEKALGDTALRLVELAGADGSSVRLLTNRLDLSPDLLGLVYRHRWPLTRRGPRSGLARGASRGLCPRAACQGFFRWLKCLVNFRHFFAESENGVAGQVLVALIGTLLLALATGTRPNSYDWAMMTHVASGLLPADEEFYRILARRRAERQRAAEWQKAYRARRKNAN
jgi:hypothetical protein